MGLTPRDSTNRILTIRGNISVSAACTQAEIAIWAARYQSHVLPQHRNSHTALSDVTQSALAPNVD
eukprot:2288806-Pleurochrysis_carterae.AAC.2